MEENTTALVNATIVEADTNIITIESEEEFEEPSDDVSETWSRQFEQPLEEGSGDEFGIEAMNSNAKQAGGVNMETISNETSTASSEVTSDARDGVEMTQGQPFVLKGNANFLGTAFVRLHLYIKTLDLNFRHCTQSAKRSLAWLDDVEAGELATSKGTSVIDVEQMENEITREVDDEGCLFLAACGVVVRIKS